VNPFDSGGLDGRPSQYIGGVSTAHIQRDGGFVPVSQAMLAPTRFVAIVDIGEVPISRVRQVSRYVEEHYAPVYESPEGKTYAQVMATGPVLTGWNISQAPRAPHCDCLHAKHEWDGSELVHRACGRARRHMSNAEFVEHIQTLQFAPTDEIYNRYYETIPGNDPVLINGKVLKGEAKYDAAGKMVHDGTIRGGTRITGGRAEYNHKTKGMVHWDKGVVKEREKAYAASQKKWIDGIRPRIEAMSRLLPRKLGEL
jgi:hypothetical protein